jgi:hypothetical protein
MLALTDSQLQTVMETAANIDPDRRSVYLQRIEAMSKLRRRFDDRDRRRRCGAPCLERLPGQL